jgi:hypothetical protein
LEDSNIRCAKLISNLKRNLLPPLDSLRFKELTNYLERGLTVSSVEILLNWMHQLRMKNAENRNVDTSTKSDKELRSEVL